MSYMNRPPPNGYTNGDSSGHLRRFDLETSSVDTSADERSRSRGPGGYGGFGARPAHQAVHGVARLDRTRANRRSRGEQDWGESRSRSRAGGRYGAQGGQVDEILRYIQTHWAPLASPSCNPIKVALQLNDPSSLGLADQHEQFREVHQQLQNALKVIVNEHHQGFNSSIGTFHKIQTAIHASQQRVRMLRAGLVEAKSSLGLGKSELRGLGERSRAYEKMLETVDNIEQLQLVPERLEAQISEKRFLGAVETLQEALQRMKKPEMGDIGALSELRVYLSNQEHSLTDILIEELHSHLYLKSPYCEERWKAHLKRNESSNPSTFDSEERAMHRFLETFDGSKRMQEDTARNPEADTFYYIQLLVESLSRMGTLDAAASATNERLPTEMFKAHDRALDEVEQRHPATLRSAASRQQNLSLYEGPNGEKKATLEDLLNTLYAKFEAVAEGHRVLHDVTAAILKREMPADRAMLNRSFRELWSLLQNEMRSLLHDYVVTSGHLDGRRRRKQDDASTNIFNPRPRDRNKKMFKLADTLSGSNENKEKSELVTEREDLEFMFKASVPGLVNSSMDHSAAKSEGETLDRSGTGHKLLVEPSVFNMGILLPPSLAFLNHLKNVVPPYSSVVPSTLTNFLDDFLINVFYPQLDETLLDLCNHTFNDLDAFQSDPHWQAHASKPIFKGTIRFFELIEAFCKMLDTLPHDQSFSQLIIGQLRGYYDKCYQWSKGLLQKVQMSEDSSAPPGMRLAADLATSGDVSDVVIQLLKAEGKERDVLAWKEAELLLRMVKRQRIEDADLLNDRKALAVLCTLHVSMKWLAARCSSLRYISPRALDSTNAQPSKQGGRWATQNLQTTASLNSVISGEGSAPYLPLSKETADEFDAALASFTELSTLILRTLHIDLRLQLLQGVYKAMDTTYALGQPYNDPDPAVLSLSTSLSSYDAQLTTHLLAPQYAFLTSHLHVLINNSLTGLVSSIPAMDGYGNGRMQLNVLVLQQSLKNVQPDADLNKAATFYELGEEGPDAIVERGKAEGFASDELKALVRLCWDADVHGGKEKLEEVVGKL